MPFNNKNFYQRNFNSIELFNLGLKIFYLILENEQKIEELFRLYLNDHCSTADVQLLMHYFNLSEYESVLKIAMQSAVENTPDATAEAMEEAKKITANLFMDILKKKK